MNQIEVLLRLAAPLAVGLLVAPMLTVMIRAQSPAAPKPQFEVASVRPCQAGDPAGPRRSPTGDPTPGGVFFPCATVKQLIQSAYGMEQPYAHTVLRVPLEGGPSWINSERYTINAKAAGDPSASVTHGPMLQSLLEDRFQLKIRRETKEIPVYVLTVAKNGPKLQRFEEGSCMAIKPGPVTPGQKPFCGTAMSRRNGANVTAEFFQMTVDEFSKNLGANSGPNILDRPVIDKTGITGQFNLRLSYSPDESTPGFGFRSAVADPATPSEPTGPSIFTAIQEQLGLRLEPAKGPGEVLVIDSVERPSEN
jgi:uncharacterized protein (TIGR03435 family)